MTDAGNGSPDPSDATAAPAPDVAAVLAVPSDDWAWWLPHLRAALHAVPDDEVTVVVRRLRAAPRSRLAGGRVRQELAEVLASGGALWRDLVARTEAVDDVPTSVADLLAGRTPTTSASTPATTHDGAREAARRSAAQAKTRARQLRTERDDADRRARSAEVRAAALARELDQLRAELDQRTHERDELAARLGEAAATRERAVQRERRRRDAEVARLEAELGARRRAEQDREAERRRRAEASEQAAQQARAAAARKAEPSPVARAVPGRPSRLPDGVVSDTTEAVELLLHPGRLVLVDGYNVSKQHHPELDLAGQRDWLVATLTTLAARRRVRPVVVFDGRGRGGGRAATPGRGVEVRFTPEGVTADDELVLAVAATDEPVVVVTDDRELTARLRAEGADVVGTAPFLWVAR